MNTKIKYLMMPSAYQNTFKEALRDNKGYKITFTNNEFKCDQAQLESLPSLDLYFTDYLGNEITVKLPWQVYVL